MRWVGALEVVKATNDTKPIWQNDFPVRFEVKPLVILQPEHGVPMDDHSARSISTPARRTAANSRALSA